MLLRGMCGAERPTIAWQCSGRWGLQIDDAPPLLCLADLSKRTSLRVSRTRFPVVRSARRRNDGRRDQRLLRVAMCDSCELLLLCMLCSMPMRMKPNCELLRCRHMHIRLRMISELV